jgi:hypothetical protein
LLAAPGRPAREEALLALDLVEGQHQRVELGLEPGEPVALDGAQASAGGGQLGLDRA